MTPQVEYLFPSSVLETLNFENTESMTKNIISLANPGDNLVARPLCNQDFHKGIIELLSQLTVVGDISEEMFLHRFSHMKACGNTYYILVIENTETNNVVGCGTLILEHHLTSSLQINTRGRIEDIVVCNTHRGKHLGKLLLDGLDLLAQNLGCTDLSLECKDPLVRFYDRFGFKVEEKQVYMCNRYNDNTQ